TNKQRGLPGPLEEAERRCCGGGKRPGRLRKAESGHGGPVSAGPRSGTGAREVWPRKAARPGCRGALSLWLLSLCARKEKVTRPERAKPSPSGNEDISPAPRHEAYRKKDRALVLLVLVQRIT